MIANIYSTIIESAKVAYHWKTGQTNIFANHLPNKSLMHPTSGF